MEKLTPEERALAKTNKIKAIGKYRSRTGRPLAEARHAIEAAGGAARQIWPPKEKA